MPVFQPGRAGGVCKRRSSFAISTSQPPFLPIQTGDRQAMGDHFAVIEIDKPGATMPELEGIYLGQAKLVSIFYQNRDAKRR